MRYLSFILIPLLIGGAIYSLLYTPHKSWKSWTIQSLVNAVYAFGFLFMLPQLFVNYRLKVVYLIHWAMILLIEYKGNQIDLTSSLFDCAKLSLISRLQYLSLSLFSHKMKVIMSKIHTFCVTVRIIWPSSHIYLDNLWHILPSSHIYITG